MIEEILKEFNERFPYKLAEVIDDFGSTVKNDIENFIKEKLTSFEKEVKEEAQEVIGVSKWREIGKKYKYWDYFEKEVKEDFLKRILPEEVKINLSDISLSQCGWNAYRDEVLNNANKEGINI